MICSTNQDDPAYDALLKSCAEHFEATGAPALFATNCIDLFDLWLDGFPDPAERQHYNCHACRYFLRRYGGLVRIDDDGRTVPAMWDSTIVPEKYRDVIAVMERAVRRANVSGVFLSSDAVWGCPETGQWRHFHTFPPDAVRYQGGVQTPGQAMAEKLEDYRNVSRALAEFGQDLLDDAVRVLQSEALYRSEKVLGAGEWLRDLKRRRDAAPASVRNNVVWRAVATAPAGFCHPRASMIGTLLEDLAAGLTYATVARRFAQKMHPSQYQRPQAAPAAATIKQAEDLVAKLGIERSLRRRFARVDEIEALWRPVPAQEQQPATGGVFAHLTPKGSAPRRALDVPAQTMTWVKFARDVLPTAEWIEALAPRHGNYGCLTTAVDPDAPPILQWDRDGVRNPFAQYLWVGGSSAHQFGLAGGSWVHVPALSLLPAMWRGAADGHHGRGLFIALDGAADTRTDAGLAIFPENLRSELHAVRSVIEAHSRSGKLEEAGGPPAAGLLVGQSSWGVTLRVHADGGHSDYTLDRWE